MQYHRSQLFVPTDSIVGTDVLGCPMSNHKPQLQPLRKTTTYPQKINISNRKISIFQLEKSNVLTKKYMFLPKQKEQSFRLLFFNYETAFIVRRAGLAPAVFVVVHKSLPIYKLPLTQSNRL